MNGNLFVYDLYAFQDQGHTKLSRSMGKNSLKYPQTTHLFVVIDLIWFYMDNLYVYIPIDNYLFEEYWLLKWLVFKYANIHYTDTICLMLVPQKYGFWWDRKQIPHCKYIRVSPNIGKQQCISKYTYYILPLILFTH